MIRRAIVFVLVVLGGLLAALPARAGTASGPGVAETRKLAQFTRVRLAFPVDASFTEGRGGGCTVRAEPTLAGRVRTVVQGGLLTVVGPRRVSDLRHAVRLDCTVKRLESVTVDTAARVVVHGGGGAHDVVLKIDGAGAVRYSGTAAHLSVTLEGAGDVVLAGKAARLTVALDGTGSIDAEGLVARNADVTIDGTGAAHLTLGGGRAKLRVHGIGSIDWGGKAADIDARGGLLGSIRERS